MRFCVSFSSRSVTVEESPPGTTVCGCGYFPNSTAYASRGMRVIWIPSRYSCPVSGFSAVIMSAIVRYPWMLPCGASVFLAFSHNDGVVRSTTTCE
jgi:hypothetical protein